MHHDASATRYIVAKQANALTSDCAENINIFYVI